MERSVVFVLTGASETRNPLRSKLDEECSCFLLLHVAILSSTSEQLRASENLWPASQLRAWAQPRRVRLASRNREWSDNFDSGLFLLLTIIANGNTFHQPVPFQMDRL